MITFFGPDGSGKTTLAKLFRSYLFSHGVYAYISWFRGSHLFASILARLLSRFTAFRGHGNPYYGVTIPLRLRRLWILIEFSSLLPHYLLRRLLSILHTVIGDRGLLDFIVWIIVTLNHPKFPSSLIGRFIARLAVGEKAIYVKAELAVLRRRTTSIPVSFLMKEIACYNVLAKYYASHTINTTDKDPKETLEDLLSHLQRTAIYIQERLNEGEYNNEEGKLMVSKRLEFIKRLLIEANDFLIKGDRFKHLKRCIRLLRMHKSLLREL